ncbi:hypothetical protein PSP31120_01705 [Pandoraea sputorum]|nr:hypothetical protein PSP31120_01705 [Pandoraea sputorum]
MIIGVQGAGKSTVARKWALASNDVIYVDSTFATVDRRSRIIEIAKAAGVPISAAWVKVELKTALRRNKSRPADEVVPDTAIENVFRIFQPPSLDEGFNDLLVLGNDCDGDTALGCSTLSTR